MSKNARSVAITAGIVGGIVGGMAGWQAVSRSFAQNVLVRTATELNKRLPMMVDEETRWDTTVAGPGNRLSYMYTLVNRTQEELDVEVLKNVVRPKLLSAYKNSPQMERFRENRVELHNQYRDESGQLILEIVVGPNDT